MLQHWRASLFLLLMLSVAALTTKADGAQALAFVGATVYSSPAAAPVPEAVVLTSGGIIIAVGKRAEVKIPKDARVIDCAGKTIVAGFWNSHVHLTEPEWNNAGGAAATALERHQHINEVAVCGRLIGQESEALFHGLYEFLDNQIFEVGLLFDFGSCEHGTHGFRGCFHPASHQRRTVDGDFVAELAHFLVGHDEDDFVIHAIRVCRRRAAGGCPRRAARCRGPGQFEVASVAVALAVDVDAFGVGEVEVYLERHRAAFVPPPLTFLAA